MIFAATLLLLAQAGATEAIDEGPSDECADPQDQHTINMCALVEYEAADADLNAQWALTVAEMKVRDADIDREYDKEPGYYETLLESQRAWLKYRDAHCLAESFLFRGGSAQPMMDSLCKAELTRERIGKLRFLVEQ